MATKFLFYTRSKLSQCQRSIPRSYYDSRCMRQSQHMNQMGMHPHKFHYDSVGRQYRICSRFHHQLFLTDMSRRTNYYSAALQNHMQYRYQHWSHMQCKGSYSQRKYHFGRSFQQSTHLSTSYHLRIFRLYMRHKSSHYQCTLHKGKYMGYRHLQDSQHKYRPYITPSMLPVATSIRSGR